MYLGNWFRKSSRKADVFPSELAGIDFAAVLRIGETDVDRLVKENDIGVRVPAVGIEGHIMTAIRNTARTKLEEQPSGGTTARASIQPQDEIWRIA